MSRPIPDTKLLKLAVTEKNKDEQKKRQKKGGKEGREGGKGSKQGLILIQ